MRAQRPSALAAALALLACTRRLVLGSTAEGAAKGPVVEAPSENEASHPTELRPLAALATAEDASIFGRYLDTCKKMQVKPSADALISLQLGSHRLTIRPSREMPFGDLDMRALVTLLEDDHGAKLIGLRHLDLSSCSLGPAGMLLVTHLLQHPRCELEYLDVSNQVVDKESVSCVISAIGHATSLKVLRMSGCDLGDQGGQLVVDFLANESAGSLEVIDIQNNFISFEVCNQISKVARQRHVKVNLKGNRVLDEVFNSVSHCVGEILSIIGSIALVKRVGCDRPPYQVWSIILYCGALNILYLSSTLFHAFFALGRATVRVFSILDYSSIFLLIAGSYSPFLGIVFYEECWAAGMLAFMWGIAIVGICTAAFYTGPYGVPLRLTLYIAMGWTVLICARPLARKLGTYGFTLLFVGGVLYTGGTPFFVRGRHTLGVPDHTIWHLFVVGGSVTHYICVYKYVVHDKEARAAAPETEEYMSVPLGPL